MPTDRWAFIFFCFRDLGRKTSNFLLEDLESLLQ